MPMPHCKKTQPYQNLFLTVPDRGFSKEDLERFINTWRNDYDFCEIAREPYDNPQAGWSHHYHVGLCFSKRVGIGRLWTAANKLANFSGMDFRWPITSRGKSAEVIFTKYFHDPSKYKRLDEEPTLVRRRCARPPNPSVLMPARDFLDRLREVVEWSHS